MLDVSLIGILITAFGVGMIHAFDADHVLAVASLSSSKNKIAYILKYSIKWALGHGGTLLLCGFIFIVFNIKLDESIARIAEIAIGIILCVAGVHLLWMLKNKKIEVVEHTHNGVEHTHLVEGSKAQLTQGLFKHNHTPVLVGFVHGLAGSAPVIALLPSVMLNNDLSALLYLSLFSIGCLLGMACFGAFLANAQSVLHRVGGKAIIFFRALLGTGAIAFGIYWLLNI